MPAPLLAPRLPYICPNSLACPQTMLAPLFMHLACGYDPQPMYLARGYEELQPAERYGRDEHAVCALRRVKLAPLFGPVRRAPQHMGNEAEAAHQPRLALQQQARGMADLKWRARCVQCEGGAWVQCCVNAHRGVCASCGYGQQRMQRLLRAPMPGSAYGWQPAVPVSHA